jgi:hypothetical protein
VNEAAKTAPKPSLSFHRRAPSVGIRGVSVCIWLQILITTAREQSTHRCESFAMELSQCLYCSTWDKSMHTTLSFLAIIVLLRVT